MNKGRQTATGSTKGRRVGIVGKLALLLLIAVLFLAAYLLFEFRQEIYRLSGTADTVRADAIVVLTGDGARISKAVDLLRSQQGQRLLISGVNERTSRTAIRSMIDDAGEQFDCCVDIDRDALDTVGNARQTRIWADRLGFRSLIVVTSDYHLPRSLIEFRRAMPEIDIYPVSANERAQPPASNDPDRFRRLAQEFLKYVAARLHLSRRAQEANTPPA